MKSKNVVYPVMLVIFEQTTNNPKNTPKVYSVLYEALMFPVLYTRHDMAEALLLKRD